MGNPLHGRLISLEERVPDLPVLSLGLFRIRIAESLKLGLLALCIVDLRMEVFEEVCAARLAGLLAEPG
jgi:hypothetical protein